MATKKNKDLKNLSKDELVAKIREAQANLFETRMKQKTGQLEEINTPWKIRKEIARMKTLLTQAQTATK
jgi:large subunit ribosomal protein L29